MKIKLKNANIMVSPEKEIFFGEIVICGDKIEYIGKEQKENNENQVDRMIDCKGNLVMSSFCNTHAHSAMTLMRGIAEDVTLESWLFDKIFPMEKHLTYEDIYWGTKLAQLEMVRGGTTCYADMYLNMDAMAEAIKNTPLDGAIVSAPTDFDGSVESSIIRVEKYYNKYNGVQDNLKFIMGLHAEYTCCEKLISAFSDLAISYGAQTYIHMSETLDEVGKCTTRHNGLTPPQYLHKLGFFENGAICAHCTHVDKDDIAIMRESNVYPAINSCSNLKLGSGIAPVNSMISNGLTLTIGTDGAASNNALSMFREMYLFSSLQKGVLNDASVAPAVEALKASTVNGFKALGFDGGTLEVGKKADMIIVDLSAPNMRPINSIKNSLVFSADNSNVLTTISNGQIVYDKGEYFVGEDVDKIYAECEKSIKRIKSLV